MLITICHQTISLLIQPLCQISCTKQNMHRSFKCKSPGLAFLGLDSRRRRGWAWGITQQDDTPLSTTPPPSAYLLFPLSPPPPNPYTAPQFTCGAPQYTPHCPIHLICPLPPLKHDILPVYPIPRCHLCMPPVAN